MVGSDTPEYFLEFADFKEDFSWDFLKGRDRQQPGWLLLSWFLRQITDDFIIMKLLLAVCYQIAVFSFFKRESKYIFLCVFLFAINTYLVTNFNVLRQCWAITFGLYAISYMNKKQWGKYALFTFWAYMFHNTALVLLAIPVFKYIVLNKKMIPLIALGGGLVIYILYTMDFVGFAYNLFSGGVMNEDASRHAISYMSGENLGVVGRSFQITPRMILVLLVISYSLYKNINPYFTGLSILYFFILLLSTMMPILWRFRLFFDFPYFVILSNVIIEAPLGKLRQVKMLFYIIALALAFLFPYRDYVRREPGQKHRYIDQYYPYHSILDPVKEERL